MGSLKRKSASLGGSAASNKRPSREDTSTRGAISNGYVGRRSGGGQALPPSSSSSSSAAAAASAVDASDVATAEALCNGTSISTETGEDPHPSISAPLVSETKSNSLKDATISESEPGCPVDPQDQEADITIVLSERSHSNNLGPLTPNHAGWFSWTSIHALEQRWLPEFFNSKSKLKTPALYMEYRNLILRKYLENPDKVFTLTDISQVIEQKGGHLEPAKRIFEFLNHWGLLNSRALQHAEAEKPTARLKSATDNQSAGKSQSSLMSKLYRFESPSAVHPSRASSAYDKVMPNVVMSESAASDAQGGMQGIPVEYHCNTCSADCSKKRFHCQKQADFDLCPDCYNEGKFSFGITSTDFILMEAVTDSSSSDGWSDQETLLLLEALEMFGDNFSEIAEHVASKTKAQCILHFIRLPIEDPFLEALEPIGQPVADSLENVACEGDAQEGNAGGEAIDRVDEEDGISVSENVHLVELVENEERDSSATNAIRAAAEAAGLFASDTYLALSECGNPVMTLVAFLAALVAPDVVANSAETALKVLADHASALQLADENSFHLELEVPAADAADAADAVVRKPEEDVESKSDPDLQELPDAVGETAKSNDNDKGTTSNNVTEPLIKGSSLVRVKNAATTALAAAAVKAQFLADQEEWEILRLAAFVVDSQTKKIEAKLKLFRELEVALERERVMLERSRQRLFAERSQSTASRAFQASSFHANLNGAVGAASRPPSISRVPSGFVSMPPPASTGPFRAPGPNDYIRASAVAPAGMNMAPVHPMYYSNAGQF